MERERKLSEALRANLKRRKAPRSDAPATAAVPGNEKPRDTGR